MAGCCAVHRPGRAWRVSCSGSSRPKTSETRLCATARPSLPTADPARSACRKPPTPRVLPGQVTKKASCTRVGRPGLLVRGLGRGLRGAARRGEGKGARGAQPPGGPHSHRPSASPQLHSSLPPAGTDDRCTSDADADMAEQRFRARLPAVLRRQRPPGCRVPRRSRHPPHWDKVSPSGVARGRGRGGHGERGGGHGALPPVAHEARDQRTQPGKLGITLCPVHNARDQRTLPRRPRPGITLSTQAACC
jgi:hypothetical protein